MECEIVKCETTEYESELTPSPIPSQEFIQEFSSLEDITNPMPYTIYSVNGTNYYYENGEFISLGSGGGNCFPINEMLQMDRPYAGDAYVYEKYKNSDITHVGDSATIGLIGRYTYLPNVTSIGSASSIVGGEIMLLPNLEGNVTSLGNAAKRKVFDIGKLSVNQNYMFSTSNSLEKLIMRVFSEPTSSTFNNSTLATNKSGAYVYVPQSLLSQFQSSSAWSNYAKVLGFRTIEGSEFEDIDAYFESL